MRRVPKGLRESHTQRVLAHVREHPAQNQRTIARACGCTEGVTRKHLALLLQRGLVATAPPAYAPRYAAMSGPVPAPLMTSARGRTPPAAGARPARTR